MKLVIICGNSAVGKMTVGQELKKITDLALFHTHMVIEPVLEVFGSFHGRAIERMRDAVFEEFAASGKYGLIFTYMWAFDCTADWAYIEHVKSIFAPYDTQVYYVELVAPQSVRLARNRSENRLQHKASKRDIAASDARLLEADRRYRCESLPGEIAFDNYLRLDNSDMPPEEAARRIKAHFDL